VLPAARLTHFKDFYSNWIQHFEITEPHSYLLIEASSRVTTRPSAPLPDEELCSFDQMREALLYVLDQKDYVLGIAGDEKNGHPCYSFYTCGTPLAIRAATSLERMPRRNLLKDWEFSNSHRQMQVSCDCCGWRLDLASRSSQRSYRFIPAGWWRYWTTWRSGGWLSVEQTRMTGACIPFI